MNVLLWAIKGDEMWHLSPDGAPHFLLGVLVSGRLVEVSVPEEPRNFLVRKTLRHEGGELEKTRG